MQGFSLAYLGRKMSSRRRFTPKEMELVFTMCEGKCFYCNKKLVYSNFELGDRGAWHCDHLIPFAKGGMTNPLNAVAACVSCNSKKSDMTHVEFIKQFGGKNNVDNFVRCHEVNISEKRCRNRALKRTRQTLYCQVHQKNG